MYIAGHNQPGYLPESEPQVFDTFAEAHEYQIETLKVVTETLMYEDDPKPWDEFLTQLRSYSGPFEIEAPDGYNVWVTEDDGDDG